MSDVEIDFHKTWLGFVQPVEGLVFSIPVLVDAGCMERKPVALQQRLRDLAPPTSLTRAPPASFTTSTNSSPRSWV